MSPSELDRVLAVLEDARYAMTRRRGAGAGDPRRGRAGGRRQARRARARPARDARRRPRPARGRPGPGQDADGAVVRRRSTALRFARVQFTPDLMPVRHHRLVDVRPRDGEFVPARAGLHQRAARRRDQPRAAEDAGRAARGDGGAPGDDRRRDAPARAPVHRDRDAEPDRVRGHLPAAGGAARPLPRCASRSATRRADDGVGGARARIARRAEEVELEPVVDRDELLAMQRASRTSTSPSASALHRRGRRARRARGRSARSAPARAGRSR